MIEDPLLQWLGRLPEAEPDPVRAASVRARARAQLARRPRPRPRPRDLRRMWAPLIAGLGGVYFAETIRQSLRLSGIL